MTDVYPEQSGDDPGNLVTLSKNDGTPLRWVKDHKGGILWQQRN